MGERFLIAQISWLLIETINEWDVKKEEAYGRCFDSSGVYLYNLQSAGKAREEVIHSTAGVSERRLLLFFLAIFSTCIVGTKNYFVKGVKIMEKIIEVGNYVLSGLSAVLLTVYGIWMGIWTVNEVKERYF